MKLLGISFLLINIFTIYKIVLTTANPSNTTEYRYSPNSDSTPTHFIGKTSSLSQIDCKVINQKIAILFQFETLTDPQPLYLALSTTTEGIYVFQNHSPNCIEFETQSYENICYNTQLASKASWCHIPRICSIENLCLKCTATEDIPESQEYMTLEFDGLLVKDERVQGYDNFDVEAITTDESVPLFQNFPIQLITHIEKIPHIISPVTSLDGIVGIAGPQINFRGQSFWNDLFGYEKEPIFGIDSFIPLPQKNEDPQNNEEPQNSFAKILTYENSLLQHGEVTWSERRQTGDSKVDALYQFPIYNFTVCKANILGDYTSSWKVDIDTSSQCLVLPTNLYQNLISWVPVKPTPSIDPENPDSSEWIPSKLVIDDSLNDFTKLPTLSFKLEQFSDQLFYIPLQELVYYDSELSKNVLCITEKPTVLVKYDMTSVKSIGFGISVLNILYPVIDMKGYRVGLVQKTPVSPNDEELCHEKVVCSGKQSYITASNSCMDPNCSVYYFMTLNNETKECQIASFVLPMALSIVFVLAASEFVLSYFYHYLVKVTAAYSK